LKKIFLPLLITLAIFAEGQGRIDLVTLKAITTDPDSPSYYDSLIKIFVQKPEVFDQTRAIRFYYGKLFSKNYRPYYLTENEKKFAKLLAGERYTKAMQVGDLILKEDPGNFAITVHMFYLCKDKKLVEKTDTLERRINIFLKAIRYSGDGLDEASPIKVVAIPDEYAMMRLLGYTPLTRSTIRKESSALDLWAVKQGDEEFNLCFEVLLNTERWLAGNSN
jgi:hypothetical protein